MMKKGFNFLVGIVLMAACSYENPGIPEEILPVADGQSIRTEEIVALSAYRIQEPSGLLKSGSQVIIGDWTNTANVFRIDLSDHSCEGMLPRVRTRSGGAAIFHGLTPDGQGGWTVFNCNSRQLFGVPPVLTRAGGENSWQLPADHRHLYAVRAGKYVIATGVYPEGRYMVYLPENGQTCYSVAYPEHPMYPELQERAKAILFASNVLRVRPDGGAFVCADMYSGIMDICRIEDGKASLVRRLTYHYPKVRIRHSGDWPHVVYSRDNRFGFTDVCTTDKSIYALYSGRTYRNDQKNFQHCRTLMELDWNGKVLQTRSVDADLTQIAYDAKEKALYGIAWRPDATLVRLEIGK